MDITEMIPNKMNGIRNDVKEVASGWKGGQRAYLWWCGVVVNVLDSINIVQQQPIWAKWSLP